MLPSTQLSPTTPTVRMPTLYHSDPDAHILIMGDAGPLNLKAWYPTAPTEAIPPIGAALGVWLAQLHHRTRNLRSHIDNVTAKGIYRYAYANLATAFEKHGLDPAYARSVDEEFGSKLATDNVCVCHGDFWPGNVLVREQEADGSETLTKTLSIVDWEITRRGIGATDVAQFAAEAYLLDRFYGEKGLLQAFLEAYVGAARENGEVGGNQGKEEFVKRLIVHFGVHVAFWPSVVEWCGKEETGDLVKLGKTYIETGWGANWASAKEGLLEPVLGLLE
ncbi:hypothetical protein DIS24_g11390 [Lasiodiplodia hormozganensis]|uniref:Aminoglycoside phosphotransferase domain-containing protein n=1 Tax=Lasiodiplodia hormozganensis TaxID=869390 RepID=A0AA39WV15_9PEZI|nr:hypothetical protein DIS24_g11390 [Lasiodiplodia hormozganensis]